jgi:hypothetical protein
LIQSTDIGKTWNAIGKFMASSTPGTTNSGGVNLAGTGIRATVLRCKGENCILVGFDPNSSIPLFYVSIDSGANWSLWSSSLPTEAVSGAYVYFDGTCVSNSQCYIVGNSSFTTTGNPDQSIIMSTDNAGKSWTATTSFSSQYMTPAGGESAPQLDAISCMTARHCVAGGNQYNSFQAAPVYSFFTTSDGGKSWTSRYKVKPGVGSSLRPYGSVESIDCSSAKDCTAVGPGAVSSNLAGAFAARTTDGAKTWVLSLLGGGQLYSVACPSASECLAAGYNTLTNQPFIEQSVSQGWEPSGITGPGLPMTSVSCGSVQFCVATGGSFLLGSVVAQPASSPSSAGSSSTDSGLAGISSTLEQELHTGSVSGAAAISDAVVSCGPPSVHLASGVVIACTVKSQSIGGAVAFLQIQSPTAGSYQVLYIAPIENCSVLSSAEIAAYRSIGGGC